MNKWLKDEETRRQIFIYTLTGVILLFVFTLLNHIPRLLSIIKRFLSVIMPFIWGTLFSMLMMPVSNKIENWIGERMPKKRRRAISAVAAVLLLVAAVVIIIVIIVPQLVTSIAALSTNINDFVSNTDSFSKFLEDNLHLSKDLIAIINKYSSELLSSFMNFLNQTMPSIVSAFSTTVSAIFNFFIGFFVAVYILLDREHLVGGFRKLFSVLLPDKQYRSAKNVVQITIEKLGMFFSGKLLDSLIIGIICFLAMILLDLEYPVLISIIIGITNIIPFFGPFIGAVPSVLILLINDPVHALIFLIMVVVLQQVDGNIIGPRILGDSVGLSSLWIMFAIIVGGSYFGFFGMLFGVPVFAVIYYLLKYYVDDKLGIKKKPE